MSSDYHRVSRLIQMASEIKTSPQQDPPPLIKTLGISKPQFYKDKRALEKIGFSFRYDRTQKRFSIDRDPYIPIYDLTLTETFALVMAVRQLSATDDFILTYDALNAIRKMPPIRRRISAIFSGRVWMTWSLRRDLGAIARFWRISRTP